ncbi:MAG: methionyl-tRNA formyltransferase [bacterium]
MRIIFFGSGQFSLPIVKRLRDGFTLLGVVVTKPKPRGRGLRRSWPSIAEWAKGEGISVFAPDDPNDGAFISDLIKLKPNLFVLSAYGSILSAKLLNVPSLGGINIHPSQLPKYRGPAPIQRAIMAGEKKTGITIFFMDEKIDHGKMILQETLDIEANENYGSLQTRLSERSADLIIKVIESIGAGTYRTIQQNEGEMSYAHKIKKSEMTINWFESTEKIVNLIRALSPWPGAKTLFRDKEVKIIDVVAGHERLEPRTIHVDKKKLYVGTGDGSVVLKRVKPQNRSLMSGLDFKNGFRVKKGEVIG